MQEKIQKKSPIKERILQYADTMNISRREFYRITGISRGTLESNTGITEEIMAKFIATFEEISPEWLITGRGEMLRSGTSSDHIPNVSKMVPAKAGEGIPLIPTSAMAGLFQGETIVLEYECDKYIVPAFKDAEFLISVKGSSMIPKYNSGDIVACKRMPLDTFFQWNKVYVLDTEQGALIKRVKRGTSDETITICSDNESYEPFELHRSKIYHIALVVGVIRLE